MNDKELADAVVALGVASFYQGSYELHNWRGKFFIAEGFVVGWRVAGALMERVVMLEVDQSLIGSEPGERQQILVGANGGAPYWCDIPTMKASLDVSRSSDSLPRAIIEACVEALK